MGVPVNQFTCPHGLQQCATVQECNARSAMQLQDSTPALTRALARALAAEAEVERLRAERDKFRAADAGARDAHRKLLEEYRKQAAHDAEQRENVAELEAENAELRSSFDRVENMCWDKLAADGEHGDQKLEAKLGLSLHGVMASLDPDGNIFKRPYKIQPKVLEIERFRAAHESALTCLQETAKEATRAEREAKALKARLAWFEKLEPLVHELIVAARQNEQSDKNDSDFKPRLGRALDALAIYPDPMPEHPRPGS